MIPVRVRRLAQVTACSVLSLVTAQACGPDFFPDTCVRTSRPDLPKRFVQGHLGLLQTGFTRADLLVAYRYLNGGTLDNQEQAGWQPTESLAEQYYGPRSDTATAMAPGPVLPTPLEQWTTARSQFPGAPSTPIQQDAALKVRTPQGDAYEVSYLNCPADAFRTAKATLQAREQTWGKTSPMLLDWLHAQDAVFSNCGVASATPAPAPAGSPALLRADRAYQTAASHFYVRAFPAAAAEFLAIGRDTSSPWQPMAGYLAGRVLIRQAFLARPTAQEPADYDPAILQSAGEQLRAYLATNPAPEWRRAAEAQLALVRIRLQPDQRAKELGDLVAGPAHDSNYAQDLEDLLWVASAKTPDGLRSQPEPYMTVPDAAHPGEQRLVTPQEALQASVKTRESAYQGSAEIRSHADILDWAVTLQSLADAAPVHALKQWQSTQSLPWLVAAMMLAPDHAPPPDGLLQAAATVPVSSPAWQTVTWHRARLLLAAGDTDAARALLQDFTRKLAGTPAPGREPSTVNAVRGLSMRAAPTTARFLGFVPQTLLLASSEEASSVSECQEVRKNPARHYDCVASIQPEQMSQDAATIFNTEAPLAVWLAAAQSTSLSPQLRTAVAIEGWVRSVLIDNPQQAAAFLPLLPGKLHRQATQPTLLATWMTLARNPGLVPYLNGGTQRAYSYDFVESYRDNWCYRPENFVSSPTIAAAFLKPEERTAGEREAQELATTRSLQVGQRIVHAVEANTTDPHAAEALYLVLRMIRYGCTEPAPAAGTPEPKYIFSVPHSQESKDLLQLRQDAARLLRRHYATSPWTKKAAPFVA